MTVTATLVRANPGPGGDVLSRLTITSAVADTFTVVGPIPSGTIRRITSTLTATGCTSPDLAVNGTLVGAIDTTVVFTAAGTFVCEIADQVDPNADTGDIVLVVLTIDGTPITLTATVYDDPFDRRGRRASLNTNEMVDRLFPSSGDDAERLADHVARGGTITSYIQALIDES